MSDRIRHILILLLAIIFCLSAFLLGKSLMEYHKGDQIYESAMEYVAEDEQIKETDTAESNDKDHAAKSEQKKKPFVAPISTVKRTYRNIDFTGLQKVNSDVLGWIQICGTQVDYPVVKASDNQFYLNHSYNKNRSSYGSIFLESKNSSELSQPHVVIYGHNMINKSMFGSLLHYKQQEYADNHNTITLCLPGKDLKYQVFSAYEARVDSSTYRIGFSNTESFNEMITHMKENSVIYSSVTPKAGQQILTLSTCTPAGNKDRRFVVNAVLITENHVFTKIEDPVKEEPMIITEEVIENEHPQMEKIKHEEILE